MLKLLRRCVPLGLVICLSYACSTTRLLHEDEVLLIKNKLEGLDKSYVPEAKTLLRPRPNRKLFGLFRFKPWVYLKISQGKETNFKTSLQRNFGEPPALLDSVLIQETEQVLTRYLNDKGFFQAEVQSEASIKNKKAKLTYTIKPGDQYHIRNIAFVFSETAIDKYISYRLDRSKIKKGDPYDADELNKERNEISELLRDNGFYYFNRDFIYFEIDSSLGSKQVDITLKIKKARQGYLYEPFKLDSIRMNVAYSVLQNESLESTLDTNRRDEFIFIDQQVQTIRKDILTQNLLLRHGQMFSENTLRLSQSRITDLNVFSYVNYRIIPNDSARKFDLLVLLSPSTKRQIKTDLEASTNSISFFGISGSVSQNHRNVFKGAELLELRANVGIESQPNVAQGSEFFQRTTFNTLEYGLGASLVFPRFLFPFRGWNERNYTRPRTRFSLNYSNQIRIDFNRDVFQANVGYLWTNRVGERYEFFPFEVNLARTNNISALLDSNLRELNDPFLNFSFTNHLTTSTRLSYTSDNLRSSRFKRLTYTRVNLEFAGNTLFTIFQLANLQPDQAQKTLFNLPFFQYIRADVDLRQYWPQRENSYLAGRIFLGVGLPLVNSNTLPLEKRYFIGGTNSIRAWQARSLGPGSFSGYSINRLDQFGEVKIEGSLEERFPIFNKLRGAVFLDLGNIWTLQDTVTAKKDLTNFNFNRFYQEIAVGTGFGFRYDFTYFVVRLDLGIKLIDPAFTRGNRLVARQMFDRNWKSGDWLYELNGSPPTDANGNVALRDYRFMSFNIGIGYPF